MGATVIVGHNNNREGEYRGSSALHDAVDAWYSITNISANPLVLDKLYLEPMKHRFGRLEKPPPTITTTAGLLTVRRLPWLSRSMRSLPSFC